jgi:hypothetical protein
VDTLLEPKQAVEDLEAAAGDEGAPLFGGDGDGRGGDGAGGSRSGSRTPKPSAAEAAAATLQSPEAAIAVAAHLVRRARPAGCLDWAPANHIYL